jgi:L-threonylcarbamoyladenylate synthase
MTPMALRFDLSDPEAREDGLAAAVNAVRRCELIVLPTDTVYGLGVDAFEPDGVQRLLDAKGRGRDMPPPVLISSDTTLEALATDLPEWASGLVAHYWPGPLTIVCRQQPSLRWDLGDARGTVAVRMPDDEHALELLGRTGPLAVSSANNHGHAAATDADTAEDMLGWATAVILDGGPSRSAVASTIVDCTGERPRLLREGAIGREELAGVLAGLGTELEPEEPTAPSQAEEPEDDEDEDLWSNGEPEDDDEEPGEPEEPEQPEQPEPTEDRGSPEGA